MFKQKKVKDTIYDASSAMPTQLKTQSKQHRMTYRPTQAPTIQPIEMINPGMRVQSIDNPLFKKIAPELFDILQLIKFKFLDFVTSEPSELGELHIAPCLVGSQVQRFHPEPLWGSAISPNDIDWEFFCLTKSPAALSQFIELLFTRIKTPDFYSIHPTLSMRSVSCSFDYDKGIKVDVKFTVFSAQSIDNVIRNSIMKRVICPKANLIKFPWDNDSHAPLSIYYCRNWLHFTVDPRDDASKEFNANLIAYSLVFHYLNPHYPMTDRFIDCITTFIKETKTNKKLLQSTKIEFIGLCCKKFYHRKTITSEVTLRPGDEFNDIFTSILTLFSSSSEFNIIKALVPPPPIIVEFIPSPSVATNSSSMPTPIQTEKITNFVNPALTTHINSHGFFTHHTTSIGSFCDAILRQMLLLSPCHYKALGDNPFATLKHNLKISESKDADMSKIIQNFRDYYPEINLVINSEQDRKALALSDELGTVRPSTITISLIELNNRYSPLISHQDLPRLTYAEKLMNQKRLMVESALRQEQPEIFTI